MPCRLLIAEPHQLLAQGLKSMLDAEDDFVVAAVAQDGRDIVPLAVEHQADLLITDLTLPGLNGIELISSAMHRLPALKVMVLTDGRTEAQVRAALTVGVHGYVLKDAPYDDLLHALRSVVRGHIYLSPGISGPLVQRYLRPHDITAAPAPGTQLTRRERGVLQLVAEGRTNRAAAELLHVSPKTIEKHRASVMRKLKLGSVSELTLMALEMGLIQLPAGASRGTGRDHWTN